MTGAERVRDGSCHFQRSRLIWMIGIILGMILLGWVTLSPSTIPYSYLGLFGDFLRYLVDNYHKWVCYGFYVSWLIHIVEALYGIKLCQRLLLYWIAKIGDGSLANWQQGLPKLIWLQPNTLYCAIICLIITPSVIGIVAYSSLLVQMLGNSTSDNRRKNRSKGITDPAVQFHWFIQTLLFGYASFGLLVSYKPPAKKYY